MSRSVLSAKLQPKTWIIETSHLVTVPESIEALNLPELRSRVQNIADAKRQYSDSPPFGEIAFRYELDEQDEPVVVHCSFTNRHGKQQRFMRLRRQ